MLRVHIFYLVVSFYEIKTYKICPNIIIPKQTHLLEQTMLLNHSSKLSIILSCLASFLPILPGHAALPDQETYDLITSRYHLSLEQTRGGCGYYANPSTLTVNGSQRALTVLHMRGDPGGSACNGIFEFLILSVDCNTNQVSYSDRLASPANWVENWHNNPEVASTVCAMTP